MLKIETTTKTDLKAKGLCVVNDSIVDDGEIIDIIEIIKDTYGESTFDLSITRSVKENMDND